MDRHDFVRRLIEERDELRAEYDNLTEVKAYFKKKTLKYLVGLMKTEQSSNLCDSGMFTATYAIDEGSWGTAYITRDGVMGEGSMVTDADIKTLSHQIVELGDKITTIKSKIEKLKKEDFRPQLKEFLNTNPKFDDE